MVFSFSPAEEAFRQELRNWLAENLPRYFPAGVRPLDISVADRFERFLAWHQALYRAGWMGIHWPREYGGRGASLIEQLIYHEEMERVGAPLGINPIGVWMVGPTLMHWGTEEQKRRFLPRILSAEEIWCQGYSEPGAGSDLASLQTRAVEEGDHFVVSGQKVWTSLADRAHWMILLCRTDPAAPKHRGISYLLVDMHSPGISVRPLVQLTGEADFNEVFFDGVRVPRANLVGEKNRGWQVAMTTLMFERVGIGSSYQFEALLEDLISVARRLERGGRPAIEDAAVRQRIVAFATEAAALRYTRYRSLTRVLHGQPPGPEASIGKLASTELYLKMMSFASELLGLEGQLTPGSHGAIDGGRWPRRVLFARALTIGGGTSEVQRNILGERVLGLPRGA